MFEKMMMEAQQRWAAAQVLQHLENKTTAICDRPREVTVRIDATVTTEICSGDERVVMGYPINNVFGEYSFGIIS